MLAVTGDTAHRRSGTSHALVAHCLRRTESATRSRLHPLFYRRPIMATSTRNTSGSAAPQSFENYERERVFGLFRQFGYLEAELNPLGLLPPQPHPDLDRSTTSGRGKRGAFIAAAWAWSSCTLPTRSAGAGSRNRSKNASRRNRPPVDRERALDLLLRADLFEQTLQQRYLGNKRFSLEGNTSLLPAWMRSWTWPASAARSNWSWA